jgi:hypothetical protein
MINDLNSNKNYPLPHPQNIASQDVVRIRDAFVAVDADITAAEAVCINLRAEWDQKKFEKFLRLWE